MRVALEFISRLSFPFRQPLRGLARWIEGCLRVLAFLLRILCVLCTGKGDSAAKCLSLAQCHMRAARAY